jgi:Zn finger protein HypA/HybF involved in hydrogenase expression
MEFDISRTVEEIVMQAKENQEEFIFEAIRPYCENVLQMKINKEELKQILLNSMKKQHPCEDCISRTEALRLIDEERQHLLRLNMDGAEHIIVHHARRIIEDMPSVTPQQKRGKWIEDKSGIYHCSNCNEEAYWDTDYGQQRFNYCPECGSDNREEADE